MRLFHKIAAGVLLRSQSIPLYRCIGRWAAFSVVLREATDADRLAVHQWLNPNGDPALVSPGNPYVTDWVADYDGQVAGFVQLVRHPPEHAPYTGAWLFALVVRSRRQGLGIGQALSEKVIERAHSEGAPTLDLLVYEDNVRAVRLYRKLGFEMHTIPELEPGLERECVQSGRRRVAMRKRLGDHACPTNM